jgi:hypothetical protein
MEYATTHLDEEFRQKLHDWQVSVRELSKRFAEIDAILYIYSDELYQNLSFYISEEAQYTAASHVALDNNMSIEKAMQNDGTRKAITREISSQGIKSYVMRTIEPNNDLILSDFIMARDALTNFIRNNLELIDHFK